MTTVIDSAAQPKGGSLQEGLVERLRDAEGKAAIDYAFLRQAQSEMRASFETLGRADAALAAAQSSATLVQEALALANQAYAAEATTNLDVIDAERRARDIKRSPRTARGGRGSFCSRRPGGFPRVRRSRQQGSTRSAAAREASHRCSFPSAG